MTVYVLHYIRPIKGTCAGMFIGVYSSMREVEAAKKRLLEREGFRDYPDGFRVEGYRMNADYDDPMFFTIWPPGESDPEPTPVG